MSKTVEFLRTAGVFYVATCDGDQPKARPFGATMDFQDRVYFCTNNRKEVFKQLLANPRVEICACKPDGAWIRLTGEAVVDASEAARKAMLDAVPMLRSMYSQGDGLFEVFYLQNATATIFGRGSDPDVYTL